MPGAQGEGDLVGRKGKSKGILGGLTHAQSIRLGETSYAEAPI